MGLHYEIMYSAVNEFEIFGAEDSFYYGLSHDSSYVWEEIQSFLVEDLFHWKYGEDGEETSLGKEIEELKQVFDHVSENLKDEVYGIEINSLFGNDSQDRHKEIIKYLRKSCKNDVHKIIDNLKALYSELAEDSEYGSSRKVDLKFNGIYDRTQKKVAVIATGGTIAMVKDDETGALKPARSAEDLLEGIPDLYTNVEVYSVADIDSSDMSVDVWRELGKKVEELANDPSIDGIVIAHGTDTMAYTTQYLSYAINNVRKPVILTGSQIAASEPDSDGLPNLKNSIIAAALGDYSGLHICFDSELYTAENATKAKIWDKDAFRSVGREIVGKITDDGLIIYGEIGCGTDFGIINDSFESRTRMVPDSDDTESSRYLYRRERRRRPLYYSHDGELFGPVTSFRDHFDFEGVKEIIVRPTLSLKELKKQVEDPDAKAIIFNGFGAGHIPARYHPILDRARELDKLVIVSSQAEGAVDMTYYEIGRKALEKGALPAGDWTEEEVYMRTARVLGAKKRVEDGLANDPAYKDLGNLLIDTAGEKMITASDILKYAFLLGTKLPSDEVRKKHESVLNIPIEKEDCLRNQDTGTGQDGVPNPWRDSIPAIVSYRLSTDEKERWLVSKDNLSFSMDSWNTELESDGWRTYIESERWKIMEREKNR